MTTFLCGSFRAASRAALVATAALALAAGLWPATPATSAASPAGASSRPAPTTVLDVRGLQQGDPPAVAWSERRSGRTVIHGTDGTRTPAPNRLDQFAPMGSGYVVQTIAAGGTRTRWIGADGTPGRREWRTGYGLAVSAQGEAVAFSGRAGKVWSIDEAGDRVLSFSPVPISGKGRAVDAVRRGLQGGRHQQRVHGLRQRTPPRLLHVLARHRRPRRRTCGSPPPVGGGGSAASPR